MISCGYDWQKDNSRIQEKRVRKQKIKARMQKRRTAPNNQQKVILAEYQYEAYLQSGIFSFGLIGDPFLPIFIQDPKLIGLGLGLGQS